MLLLEGSAKKDRSDPFARSIPVTGIMEHRSGYSRRHSHPVSQEKDPDDCVLYIFVMLFTAN